MTSKNVHMIINQEKTRYNMITSNTQVGKKSTLEIEYSGVKTRGLKEQPPSNIQIQEYLKMWDLGAIK